MSCPLCDKLASIRHGPREGVIASLSETVCVLADNQGSPGWCVLILNDHAEHLAELDTARQLRIFEEVARVAAALRTVFGPVRINYECLGNQVNHIHWHIIPRHADDPQPRDPIWLWPSEQQRGAMDVKDRADLIRRIREGMPE